MAFFSCRLSQVLSTKFDRRKFITLSIQLCLQHTLREFRLRQLSFVSAIQMSNSEFRLRWLE